MDDANVDGDEVTRTHLVVPIVLPVVAFTVGSRLWRIAPFRWRSGNGAAGVDGYIATESTLPSTR